MGVFETGSLEDGFLKNRRNPYVVVDRGGYTPDSTAIDSNCCASV